MTCSVSSVLLIAISNLEEKQSEIQRTTVMKRLQRGKIKKISPLSLIFIWYLGFNFWQITEQTAKKYEAHYLHLHINVITFHNTT